MFVRKQVCDSSTGRASFVAQRGGRFCWLRGCRRSLVRGGIRAKTSRRVRETQLALVCSNREYVRRSWSLGVLEALLERGELVAELVGEALAEPGEVLVDGG